MPTSLQLIANWLEDIARTADAIDRVALYIEQSIQHGKEMEVERRELYGNPQCRKEER